MANFIKPYNDDPFVGHLATPITSSSLTRALLKNLPAYRFGLTPLLRGLEIGLAHGYFLIGPFAKLGPLRDSDIGLLAGFLSTIGLILIFHENKLVSFNQFILHFISFKLFNNYYEFNQFARRVR